MSKLTTECVSETICIGWTHAYLKQPRLCAELLLYDNALQELPHISFRTTLWGRYCYFVCRTGNQGWETLSNLPGQQACGWVRICQILEPEAFSLLCNPIGAHTGGVVSPSPQPCACVRACVCSLFVLVLPGPVAKTLSSNPVYLTIVLVLKHSLTWERLKEQSMGVT